MEEKKEIRKKIFKARKEHTDAWIRENSLRNTGMQNGSWHSQIITMK